MPSQVRACFVNIIIFERCKVYYFYLGTPRETAAAAAVVSIHATDTPSTRSPMFIHVVSSRGEKEEEEEGDDFQNVRTGLTKRFFKEPFGVGATRTFFKDCT